MKHYLSNVKQLLIAVIAVLFALPTLAQAQTTSDADEDDIETIVVAGSRIARESLDSSANVQVYTAEDIADSGALTVADFLRDNTGNSFGSFSERSGSGGQSSNALVSLKGLGAERTLVLINGKRAIGTPAFGGAAANVNLIPTAAVERVEIILDGAASVYGSDAISGVINIVLKSKFDGSNVSGEMSFNAREGGDTEKFSYVSGTNTDTSSVTWGIETQSRGIVYDRDRSYSATAWNDDTSDPVGAGIAESGELTGYSTYGRNIQLLSASVAQRLCTTPGMSDVDMNASTNDTFDGTCNDANPGTNALLLDNNDVAVRTMASLRRGPGVPGVWQAGEGCEAGAFDDAGTFQFGYGGEISQNNTYCFYSFADDKATTASLDKTSIFLSANKDINEDLSISTSAFYIKNESNGVFAPSLASPGWAIPGSHPVNPWSDSEIGQRVDQNTWIEGTDDANNTYYYQNVIDNQTAVESTYNARWRFTELGLRDNTIFDTIADISVDVKWDFNDMFTFNAYGRSSQYYSSNRGDYYLDIAGLELAIETEVDLTDPKEIDKLKATTHTDNRVYHDEFGFGANIDPGVSFAGGDLQIYAGFEKYVVSFLSRFDGNSEFGQIGGSAGNTASGSRTATGIFGEVLAPLTDNVKLSFSFRNDDYSDVGGKTSFKLGGQFNLVDGISLVASVAEGYRAPGLDLLDAASSFSAETATDYSECFAVALAANASVDLSTLDCEENQHQTYYSPNKNLLPEDSSSTSFAAEFDLDALLGQGGAVTFSFYSDEISNIIQQASTQDVLWAEYFDGALLSAPGVAVSRADSVFQSSTGGSPCGPGVQGKHNDRAVDPQFDKLLYVCSTFVNVGALTTTGYTLAYDLTLDFGNLGEFDLGFAHSEVLTYENEAYIDGPVQDQVGWAQSPPVRRSIDLGYSMNNWQVILTNSFIDSHAEQNIPLNPTEGTLQPSPNKYDTWSLVDLAFKIDFGTSGKLKIDIANVTDEDPPLNSRGQHPSDNFGLYNIFGQVTTINYSYDF